MEDRAPQADPRPERAAGKERQHLFLGRILRQYAPYSSWPAIHVDPRDKPGDDEKGNAKRCERSTPMIKGLHHNAYRCRDSEETRIFYEDFLGLPFAHALNIQTTMTGRETNVLNT